ncbi:MAG: protein-L-isoaspartate(D-aspartate) O-methyltransferase [Pyrinomonadaceae bacterium]|nr:protein-L-isoaspartate(D-aspartate) O-methyltransferase [Pyrinomonadaceae bacterium]MCX7640389.1 protein-L-isoaspartate(D-aspartate) O-methyltransferase [Pyrinomonadaceae bacterium]MDW8304817.1 protein-L-isoaspartate(D-aspartate) O-methyltransferase [Acidobacteriota bacterium]
MKEKIFSQDKPQSEEFAILRSKMVEHLMSHYHIQDERVLRVMQQVPRELFVPEALKSQAYKDNALPIAAGQTISQPYIVAKMTELLQIEPNYRVLEIGTGSGYQTAILASLARSVYSIERVPQLAEEAEKRLRSLGFLNVVIRCGDGTLGWEIYAPFDAIIVTAGSPKIPEPLLSQLKIGGKMILPVGFEKQAQRLIRITRTQVDFTYEDFGACAFVPLIGEHGWK